MPRSEIVGWDIGGAHVKACLLTPEGVVDAAQWACPLWQGLDHLDRVLDAALRRWPRLRQARHAVTMTGEMVDLFAHREDGVQRIAALLARRLAPAAPQLYAGDAGDRGWCSCADAAAHWQSVASANWLATARHVAAACAADAGGVLVDIGSTTTDLIAFRAGRVLGTSRGDADRLASGELVYQGVVRTPLCALAPRIAWRGRTLNVMNEFFATSADVHRLTGQLDPAHDQHPSADDGGKDLPATRRRLARMIGLDARDGSDADWLAFAFAWRDCQLQEIGGQLQRVLALHGLGRDARVVAAGCGDFLVADLCRSAGLGSALDYGRDIARADAGLAAWARVCAPSIAVATLLLQREPG